ncbi:MAG TPA: lactate utilization protein [Thermoplasmata archaeon]|nr:lactate utilization protein [Thermoplasmata archaeon]
MTGSLEGVDAALRSRIERTVAALAQRGIAATYVPDRAAALAKIIELIPRGSSVAHGTSTTLLEIGFVDRMRQPNSGYRYLNDEWRVENDAKKRGQLRARLSVEADYYLGSVQAIAETGEVVGADQSGSRQAFYTYGPAHVIWVAGINKLVPSLADALKRVREIALPLEDQRMKKEGAPGSSIGKLVIYERERPGRTTVVLVGEKLGF